MKYVKSLFVSFVIIACVIAILSASPLGTDCEVYGSLKVDGSLCVVGSELVAVIGIDEVARTTVKQAGSYSLVIPMFDPRKPDSKGYKSENDIITVYVDGRKAVPAFNARAGKTKVDLIVKSTLEVKQTTWGKIKALFK